MPDVSAAPLSPARQAGPRLPRRGLERLDLLLLAVEALDLNGSEAMLWMGEQLGLEAVLPNRVELWKRRCANPLRRTTRRDALAPAEAEALIRIVCAMAERLYPLLRALLSTAEPPPVTQQRWALFQGRLAELLRERMNPRRAAVHHLLDPEAGFDERRLLVQTLAFAAGTGGVERLRASLLDAAA